MKTSVPTIGCLSKFKRSPQYKKTVEMFEPFVKGQDWSTREKSKHNISKIADKRGEYFHRMNIELRNSNSTPDVSYRFRELGEIMEKIVEGLQLWHYKKFVKPVVQPHILADSLSNR